MPHYLSTAGSLFTVFLGRTDPVTDFDDAKDQSTAAYAAFFHAMLDGGVYLPPSAFEAWFASAAHDEEELSRVADAAARGRARRRARSSARQPIRRALALAPSPF